MKLSAIELQYLRGLIISDQYENRYETNTDALIDRQTTMFEFTQNLLKKLDGGKIKATVVITHSSDNYSLMVTDTRIKFIDGNFYDGISKLRSLPYPLGWTSGTGFSVLC